MTSPSGYETNLARPSDGNDGNCSHLADLDYRDELAQSPVVELYSGLDNAPSQEEFDHHQEALSVKAGDMSEEEFARELPRLKEAAARKFSKSQRVTKNTRGSERSVKRQRTSKGHSSRVRGSRRSAAASSGGGDSGDGDSDGPTPLTKAQSLAITFQRGFEPDYRQQWAWMGDCSEVVGDDPHELSLRDLRLLGKTALHLWRYLERLRGWTVRWICEPLHEVAKKLGLAYGTARDALARLRACGAVETQRATMLWHPTADIVGGTWTTLIKYRVWGTWTLSKGILRVILPASFRRWREGRKTQGRQPKTAKLSPEHKLKVSDHLPGTENSSETAGHESSSYAPKVSASQLTTFATSVLTSKNTPPSADPLEIEAEKRILRVGNGNRRSLGSAPPCCGCGHSLADLRLLANTCQGCRAGGTR